MVERGIITSDMLEESTVTDEMIGQFENEFEVSVPQEVSDYLKTYCHSIRMLCAATPEGYIGDDTDMMHEINEMTPEEIFQKYDSDDYYLIERWSEIVSMPRENPLAVLKDWIKGFREFSNIVENVNEEALKRFIPIGDWMCAGPLCIDTEIKKEDIDINDPTTWQIRWFDHEEFDWVECGYIDDNGKIVGRSFFPDFETFIRLYFYGPYDKLYDKQMEAEGENVPDRSEWYEEM